MVTVEFNNKVRCEIPSSFDELNYHQLKVYVEHVEAQRNELFSKEDGKLLPGAEDKFLSIQILLLRTLLPITNKSFFNISREQIRDLLARENLCRFYFEDLLTKNPIPVLKLGIFSRVYGPINAFHKLSFEEFSFGDEALKLYNETGEVEHLHELMAVLYRAKKRGFKMHHHASDGDPRVPFNYVTYDQLKEKMANQPLHHKLMVYLWFSHCRLLMLQNYSKIFKKHKDSEGDEDGSSWINTAMNLGGGVLNFHKIKNENVYLVFEEMKRLVEERERMEEHLEKQRNESRTL